MYSSYGYDTYNTYNAGASAGAGVAAGLVVFNILYWLICIAIVVLYFVGLWKSFQKMGLKGYEALIEGHNEVILLEKAGMPMWYFFLLLIPVCNIIFSIKRGIELAKKFGKSTAFGVVAIGLFPFVGWIILGFSAAQYKD
jgi:hypothetical protein